MYIYTISSRCDTSVRFTRQDILWNCKKLSSVSSHKLSKINNHRYNKNECFSHVIRHLIHKWGYEANELIVDETTDDFESTRFAESNRFFNSPLYANQNAFKFNDGYQYPKPQRPFTSSGGNGYSNSETIYLQKIHTPRQWATFWYFFFVFFYILIWISFSLIYRPNSYISNQEYNSHEPNLNNKPITYTQKLYVTEYNPAHWLKRYWKSKFTKRFNPLIEF